MQWYLAVLVGLLAVATRIWGLGQPDVFVFDEVFYAGDALDLIAHGVEGGTAVHPPIGKWMIATGIRLLGFDPIGWRSAALAAGAVVAGLTWYLARRLVSSPIVAVAAASMVLFDGITVVTGRIALLDGFVALWVLAAVGCTLAMIEMSMDQSAQRTAPDCNGDPAWTSHRDKVECGTRRASGARNHTVPRRSSAPTAASPRAGSLRGASCDLACTGLRVGTRGLVGSVRRNIDPWPARVPRNGARRVHSIGRWGSSNISATCSNFTAPWARATAMFDPPLPGWRKRGSSSSTANALRPARGHMSSCSGIRCFGSQDSRGFHPPSFSPGADATLPQGSLPLSPWRSGFRG